MYSLWINGVIPSETFLEDMSENLNRFILWGFSLVWEEDQRL